MTEGNISLNYTPCWVYISEKKKSAGLLQVGYCRTLPIMLTHTAEDNLLYYRQFSTLGDGLGHKLLLEDLSTDSLYLTIRSVCRGKLKEVKQNFNNLL